MQIILNVPSAEKDQAKELGAKWDGIKRVWYVPIGMMVEPFECWLPAFEQISKVVLSKKIPFGASGKTKKPSGKKPIKSIDQNNYGVTTGKDYVRSVCRHIPWDQCDRCCT